MLRKLNKLSSIIKKIAAKGVKVGVPASTANYEEGMSTVVVAAVHEYGSIHMNIPARPFIRPGVKKTIDRLPKLIKVNIPAILDGSMKPKQFWGIVGTLAQSDVRGMWDDNDWAPLKNNNDPNRQILLDTGHLRQSITYQVT